MVIRNSFGIMTILKNVYLAPQGEKLTFNNENGRVNITVPKIECHQMIVLEY